MKRNQGLSLVEVLIAIFLLAVALLAIASSFVSSTKLMAHTVDKEKATLLASEIIDFIEGQEVDEAQSDWGLSFDDLSSDITVPHPFVIDSWNVTSGDNLRTIVISLTWDGVGPNDNVVLARSISPFGHVDVDE